MTKRLCTNMLLLSASIQASLAVIELLLTLFWPQTAIDRQYHEQYHPVLGWANKPNVSGAVALNEFTRTRTFYRSYNSTGLRSSRQLPYEKPAGVKRVLLVGDSYFWAYGVDDRQVVSEFVQKQAGGKVEVINGAVTGWYGPGTSLADQ